MTLPNAMSISAINTAFCELLATPTPADVTPTHTADELMVWFLLGGKDVGKSTFLNSLLGTPVSSTEAEGAEGTNRFVAYLHEDAEAQLRARFAELDVEVEYHTHTSEPHARLCLIDSPDFDSRYDRHVKQVEHMLRAGVADGAVLLASHAKYKDRDYWRAFAKLFGLLTPSHILFVMTKADEIAAYEKAMREDFEATIRRRVEAATDGGDPQVFLIDSPRRRLDFAKLEARLLRKLSADHVRRSQVDNRRRAYNSAAEAIRHHYHLDELRKNVESAADAPYLDELFDEHFPPLYFETVAERLRNRRDVVAATRDWIARDPGPTLAGLAALGSLGRRLTSWLPGRRSSESGTETDSLAAPIEEELRWGREGLGERLQRTQRESLARLRLESNEAIEPFVDGERQVEVEVRHMLGDQLAGSPPPLYPWWLRIPLNFPVYLYLLFFLVVLLHPLFLLLEAWDVTAAPNFGQAITLDNVKVSVIGLIGYYIMALLYTGRRQRERVRKVVDRVVDGFTLSVRTWLRDETERPISRFRQQFEKLTRLLDTNAEPR
ncbi:MAG: hypothetical protein P9L99_08070 [Candidatus Lernaella stagnicola]|nr:hypothetical protein [Candidatus Lernaella stagnicola]